MITGLPNVDREIVDRASVVCGSILNFKTILKLGNSRDLMGSAIQGKTEIFTNGAI